MNQLVSERLSQARELAGFNKTELAREIGVTTSAITQWENGTKNPTPDSLDAFCRATKVDLKMLMLPIPAQLRSKGPLSFRALEASKTNRLKLRAQRFADACAEVFIWLEDWVELPKCDLPDIDQPEQDIEAAATACRRYWGLGDRSIVKLGELLESKGIRICGVHFDDIRMDGFSCPIGGRAFMYLGESAKDKARARFSAAHELGHLILHYHYSDEELLAMGMKAEQDANAFASAFLLPAETFSADVADTSLNGFVRLKLKWGVSVQALVRRARDLKLITQETYERHYKTIGAKGWRRSQGEPYDDSVPAINRTVGAKCLDLLQEVETFQISRIQDALPFPAEIFSSVFGRPLTQHASNAPDNIIRLIEFGGTPESTENIA